MTDEFKLQYSEHLDQYTNSSYLVSDYGWDGYYTLRPQKRCQEINGGSYDDNGWQ